MLKKIFSKSHDQKIKNDQIVNAVIMQTSALFDDLQKQINQRFQEIKSQIKEVELSIEQLETKLLTKDLKDKQAYGLLHYKLHEAKNNKLQDEIKELEIVLGKKESEDNNH